MSASHAPQDIHRAIVEMADRGCSMAVAVLLKTDGSTPCPAGAKAVVAADGSICGTIGGGQVEAEAQRRAIEAIRTGRPEIFEAALQGGAVDGQEPICGGRMRVLISPTTTLHHAAYAAAATARERREPGVLLTTVHGLDDLHVAVQFLPERVIPSEVPFPGFEAIRSALNSEKPNRFVVEPDPTHQRIEVLVEPLIPTPRLLIVGGGHVGQGVAVQASLVGFEVVVLDDRPEFTAPELFPKGVTTRCGGIGQEVAAFPFGSDTYVVIVTRGHQHDAEALKGCLGRPTAYLGMIGSRRKVAMLRKELLQSGQTTVAAFDQVYAPIGLDIGSVTVPEIACSIVAQLIAVRRTGSARCIPQDRAS
jgi:xanthine dehydrogenase accessory factor